MSASITESGTQLERLATGVRSAIDSRADWSHTAQLVADQLRAHLPGPDVLAPEQRLGSPERAAGHTLHVEPNGSFSITAMVWRPGQATRIHDHTTWCVFGVIQGIEHEDVYDADLNLIGENDNLPGDVNGFARPATSTASTTRATRSRSRSTSTGPTSRASAPACAATTTSPSPDGHLRQEEWQDAPEGVPQDRTGSWVRRSDEYTTDELTGGSS